MTQMARVKIGFLCGILAAALFLIGDAMMGSEEGQLNAATDPVGYAAVVTGPQFSFWALRGVIGSILETIFALALWHYLSRTNMEGFAWWGAVFSIIGDFFGALMFGIAYFVAPALAPEIAGGNTSLLGLTMPPPSILIGLAAGTYIGLFLSVFAIWRTDQLPKWAALLWLIGMLLVPIQIFAIQVIASNLWLIAGIGFVLAVWSRQTLPE